MFNPRRKRDKFNVYCNLLTLKYESVQYTGLEDKT